jgi:DNA mismatch repair protein MutL
MLHDDALLAFERHATSKIQDADDLLNISTLGFRGEALPSISSVSRLTLTTKAAEEAAGTRIEIAGGKMLRVEEAGLPAGTSIEVRDLFFNIPARKKISEGRIHRALACRVAGHALRARASRNAL